MKILTIGSSPFILAKGGRINSSIINDLKDSGHEVGSIVFDHDPTFFAPDEHGNFFFETDDGKQICPIWPIPRGVGPHVSQSVVMTYDQIKNFEPDVVLAIGDIEEVEFVSSIKEMEQDAFKLIFYLLIDSFPVNRNKKESLNPANKIICSTQRAAKSLKEIGLEAEVVYFGPSDEFEMKEIEKDDNFNYMQSISLAKNSTSCNPVAIMRGVDENEICNTDLYMHTNICDKGDYDLESVRENCLHKKHIILPEGYVSIFAGISDENLAEYYKASHVVIDCPVRSATALSVLEGMRCGCIPLVTRVGALEEVVSKLPSDCQFFVDSATFFASSGEEWQIALYPSIAEKLKNISRIWEGERMKWRYMSNSCIEIALEYSKKEFLDSIRKSIENTVSEVTKFRVEEVV